MSTLVNVIRQGSIHIRRGRAWLPQPDLATAKASALSGDTIIVGPGSYTVAASLAKDGVNWHFAEGAAVDATAAANSLFSDGGTPMSFAIGGSGIFRHTATASYPQPLIYVGNAASSVSIRCSAMRSDRGGVVRQEGGTLVIDADLVRARNDADTLGDYGLWWSDGDLKANVRRIDTRGLAVYSTGVAAPVGEMWVTADQIIGAWQVTGPPASKTWVIAKYGKGIINQLGGRLYVFIEKLEAVAEAGAAIWLQDSGGSDVAEFWGQIQKLTTATSGQPMVKLDAGTSFIDVMQFEDLVGGSSQVQVAGGTHRVWSSQKALIPLAVGASSGSGIEADTLDGFSSAAFALVGHNHTGTYQPLNATLTAIAANAAADLYPTTFTLLHAHDTVISGSETMVAYGIIAGLYQTSATVGDSFEQKFFAKAGTYTLRFVGESNNDRSPVRWHLDGVQIIASQDWNATVGDPVIKTVTGVTIAGNGEHTLKGTVLAGGSGYIVLHSVTGVRTGA